MSSSTDLANSKSREQLLRAAWLRHDAMWFQYVAAHWGMNRVNEANRAIAEALGQFEMLNLLRHSQHNANIENIDELLRLFSLAIDIYQTHHSPVRLERVDHKTFSVSMSNCWACKAVELAGWLDQYQCGPWARLKGWLSALKLKSTLNPDPNLCLEYLGVNKGRICSVMVVIDSFSKTEFTWASDDIEHNKRRS